MCLFTYDKLKCPDCTEGPKEDVFSIPSAVGIPPCDWARSQRILPSNCPNRHEEWSRKWSMMKQPCKACRRYRDSASDKVKEWAKQEEEWREQNPLEDRVGEEIPEADRRWKTPLILEDDDSTTTEEEARNDGPGP